MKRVRIHTPFKFGKTSQVIICEPQMQCLLYYFFQLQVVFIEESKNSTFNNVIRLII